MRRGVRNPCDAFGKPQRAQRKRESAQRTDGASDSNEIQRGLLDRRPRPNRDTRERMEPLPRAVLGPAGRASPGQLAVSARALTDLSGTPKTEEGPRSASGRERCAK